jgi:hypothetical protein
MGHVITLDLPSDLARHAQAVAVQSHRRVEDVLLEWKSSNPLLIKRRVILMLAHNISAANRRIS